MYKTHPKTQFDTNAFNGANRTNPLYVLQCRLLSYGNLIRYSRTKSSVLSDKTEDRMRTTAGEGAGADRRRGRHFKQTADAVLRRGL